MDSDWPEQLTLVIFHWHGRPSPSRHSCGHRLVHQHQDVAAETQTDTDSDSDTDRDRDRAIFGR